MRLSPAQKLITRARAGVLGYELAECLWWIFSLADRFDVDMAPAFSEFLEERERRLRPAVHVLTGED